MGVEIERKFLVEGDGWRTAEPIRYSQGYLNRDHMRTVRVRVAGSTAYLTIKGPTTGASRAEYEYRIPQADAAELLSLCEQPIIEKNRYVIDFDGFKWEVDEFLGDNHGLIVAEIELESEDQQFAAPDWLGAEVTLDARYFNSQLSIRPYSTW